MRFGSSVVPGHHLHMHPVLLHVLPSCPCPLLRAHMCFNRHLLGGMYVYYCILYKMARVKACHKTFYDPPLGTLGPHFIEENVCFQCVLQNWDEHRARRWVPDFLVVRIPWKYYKKENRERPKNYTGQKACAQRERQNTDKKTQQDWNKAFWLAYLLKFEMILRMCPIWRPFSWDIFNTQLP